MGGVWISFGTVKVRARLPFQALSAKTSSLPFIRKWKTAMIFSAIHSFGDRSWICMNLAGGEGGFGVWYEYDVCCVLYGWYCRAVRQGPMQFQ